MRTFVVVLLGAVLASANPLDKSLNEDSTSEDGWFVPQLDGSFEWVVKVKFYLYTKSNPSTPQQIFVDDIEALSKSNFNKDHPTRFIIHGWLDNYLAGVNDNIRAALLDTGEYNVICVDWSHKAKRMNYIVSVKNVPGVGKKVAAMVDFLNQFGDLSFDNVNLIGHSLGAHVSGYTGKYVTRGQIHTIIGLDPALPLYRFSKCSERLCETDAYYVESIQTNGGQLGFLKPIGKATFYPNGGKSQPGCGIDLTGSCAHARSYAYYAEAIREDDFLSMKCSDYEKAVHKKCNSTYSVNVRLGESTNDRLAKGSYFTPVNKKAPYGKG